MHMTKHEEAREFVNKKGTDYSILSATVEEREYFKGSIYSDGFPNLSYIYALTSPSNC